MDRTQDSFGEDRKLIDDRVPNPTFDDIDQKEKEFWMLERKANFEGSTLFNLSRRLVNSGLLDKMDNVEDVKQLGRALVNLESLHLTHIGELPEQKKMKVNKRTTNDDVKRFQMEEKKRQIDYLNKLNLKKQKDFPEKYKPEYNRDR